MRVLVCGDRNWVDSVRDPWGIVMRELSRFPQGTVVIHGDCRGADKIAGHTAKTLGFDVLAFPADWNTHGRAAGPIRNRQMLKEGKPDMVLAFHTNIATSKGTRDMLKAAEGAGIETHLYTE